MNIEEAEGLLKSMREGVRPRRTALACLVMMHNRGVIRFTKEDRQMIINYGWCDSCIRFTR